MKKQTSNQLGKLGDDDSAEAIPTEEREARNKERALRVEQVGAQLKKQLADLQKQKDELMATLNQHKRILGQDGEDEFFFFDEKALDVQFDQYAVDFTSMIDRNLKMWDDRRKLVSSGAEMELSYFKLGEPLLPTEQQVSVTLRIFNLKLNLAERMPRLPFEESFNFPPGRLRANSPPLP